MALSDLMANFRGQQAAPAAPAPTLPGNIPANAALTTPANNTTGANGIIPPAAVTPDTQDSSPLDEFNGLWDTDPNAPAPDQFGILGEINAQKIQEVAGKVNFAKVVKAEDIAAIKAGGDDAVAALGRALNATSQAVYGQSAVASSKLIEQATSRLEQKLLDTLPAKIKALSFSNSLREENPAYSHPAAAPIVTMIEQQIAAKYPNATSSELTEMAQDYFTRTFSAISGEDKKKATEASNIKETNWLQEFNL